MEETRRQIEAETHRALEAIRSEVAELTLVAATKVTGKALDDADHRRLIDDAIRELDFSRLEQDAVRRAPSTGPMRERCSRRRRRPIGSRACTRTSRTSAPPSATSPGCEPSCAPRRS